MLTKALPFDEDNEMAVDVSGISVVLTIATYPSAIHTAI
jgi:hypothetical protein